MCHEGQVIERKSKKIEFSMAVVGTQSVTSLLGQTSRPTMSKMWAIFSREKVKGGKQVVCINGDYEEKRPKIRKLRPKNLLRSSFSKMN